MLRGTLPRSFSAALLALVACAPDASTSTTSVITTATGTTTSDATTITDDVTTMLPPAISSEASDSTTTTGASTVPDVGAGGWELPDACGALDLVFVVERSDTTAIRMYNDLDQLMLDVAAALPGWSIRYLFVEGRVGTIPLFCEDACANFGECDEAWADVVCDQLDACDWRRGAGLRWDSADERCITGEPRWLDGDDPDLVDEAQCLWKTSSGAGELDTISSLLTSVSADLIGPDGCNGGFLRDEAFLAPVIVSHGYPSAAGSPLSWAGELADAKNGDDEAIVPVAILDPNTPGCGEGPGDQTGEYQAFVELFEGAVIGSICTAYRGPVMTAVERIADRCAALPD